MSRIILFGGHGHVARHLIALLVAGGDSVTGVIRNPDHAPELAELGAEPVVADIERLTIGGLGELIAGHDAVVWSAGAGGGDPTRTWAVDRDAAVHSMQAAAAAGVRRYVMVSWAGSRIDHGVAQDNDFFPYAQAKAIADAALRDSGLEYTIVAPGTLTFDAGTGRVGTASAGGRVPRADVAALLAAVLDDPASIGHTYRFDGGETAVADFVAAGGAEGPLPR